MTGFSEGDLKRLILDRVDRVVNMSLASLYKLLLCCHFHTTASFNLVDLLGGCYM